MPLPRYKEIVELIKKGATVEAQEQIMALREGALELQEENQALKERLSELEEELKLSGEMEFDGSVYWRVTENERHGPYCPRCYDADTKLIRLQDWGDAWNCFQCKNLPEKS